MSDPSNVVGVILAAGEGSRMGSVKQMLPFRGRTILECVIDSAIASALMKVFVVIGHRADLLEPMLTGKDVTIVINEDYKKSGQSSSLKAGLRALPEQTGAVLFMLGDQPLVTPETINLILHAFQASQSPIVLPIFNGKRGNPVLFSRETFPRLEALTGDCGARPLFKEYAGHILQIETGDHLIHFDVDSEEDYRCLLELDAESAERDA